MISSGYSSTRVGAQPSPIYGSSLGLMALMANFFRPLTGEAVANYTFQSVVLYVLGKLADKLVIEEAVATTLFKV
mgnify:CR=1 FL=1